jgi:hypothetical protein
LLAFAKASVSSEFQGKGDGLRDDVEGTWLELHIPNVNYLAWELIHHQLPGGQRESASTQGGVQTPVHRSSPGVVCSPDVFQLEGANADYICYDTDRSILVDQACPLLDVELEIASDAGRVATSGKEGVFAQAGAAKRFLEGAETTTRILDVFRLQRTRKCLAAQEIYPASFFVCKVNRLQVGA